MQVNIDLQNVLEDQNINFSIENITHYAKTALEYVNYTKDADITVRITNEDEIHSLNKEYRHVDKPTNILSFPFECPDEVQIPLLGDLIICHSVVEREAKEQNKSFEEHFCHLIIHGCLHLLGYDHIKEQEAEEMEQLEINILAKLGFKNPYE